MDRHRKLLVCEFARLLSCSAPWVVGIAVWGMLFPVLSCAEERRQDDWTQWRGPNSNGIATSDKAPLEWGESKNILWRTPVPGRGHSSPTVVGDRVYLATADEQADTQSLLAFDRSTGESIWTRTIFEKGHDPKAHKRNSQASSTVAYADGKLFVSFLNDGAVWVLAFDEAGKELWRKKVEEFVSHWGYSASPTIYKSLVLISADHKGGGSVAALSQSDGEIVWSKDRPAIQNYTSPIVFRLSGRDQMILAGCDLVSSYDPKTGELLWETKATTEECVGTVVAGQGLAFASGGYPKHETIAIRTDGSGEVAWRNRVRTYVPSLLLTEGYLYSVTDKGIAYCWDAPTGKEMWKQRVGGVFNSSPMLVGDKIYAAREDGVTFVFRADPTKYTELAKNRLGEEIYSTPTICGGKIYLRFAEGDGNDRREFLVCIGEESP